MLTRLIDDFDTCEEYSLLPPKYREEHRFFLIEFLSFFRGGDESFPVFEVEYLLCSYTMNLLT